jgi:hypothetical protein
MGVLFRHEHREALRPFSFVIPLIGALVVRRLKTAALVLGNPFEEDALARADVDPMRNTGRPLPSTRL